MQSRLLVLGTRSQNYFAKEEGLVAMASQTYQVETNCLAPPELFLPEMIRRWACGWNGGGVVLGTNNSMPVLIRSGLHRGFYRL